MREIKFRMLDRSLGKWFVLSFGEIADGGSSAWCDVDWSTRGEWTGLKDKNGRDVYEGDILNGFGEVVFGKIGYDGSWNGLTGFYFKNYEIFRKEFMELEYNFDPEDIEVIGNRYENPELLEQKGGGR